MNVILRPERRLRLAHRSAGMIFSALLSACASQTLFQSNFDATPVGQPPAHVQQVGTANVSGMPGNVVVVASPVQTGGKWVQVSRPSDPVTIVAFQGELLAVRRGRQLHVRCDAFHPHRPGDRERPVRAVQPAGGE